MTRPERGETVIRQLVGCRQAIRGIDEEWRGREPTQQVAAYRATLARKVQALEGEATRLGLTRGSGLGGIEKDGPGQDRSEKTTRKTTREKAK